MLRTLTSAYAVGVSSRISAQLIAFVSMMVASRYLDLASFGSFILAWTVTVIFVSLLYTGLYQALLRSDAPDNDASSYFWMMGAVSLTGTTVSAGLGVLTGGFETATGTAFLMLAPVQLLDFPIAWNEAQLVARKRVRTASLLTLPSQLAALAATWIALDRGLGIQALILGHYVSAVVGLALTTALVRRLPRLELRRQALRDSRRTVPNLWGSSLLAMFSNYGADLILGAFLTTAAVGAYRGGSRITQTISDFVLQPLNMLSWSRFSRLEKEQDIAGMRAAWSDNMAAAGALLWPMMLSLGLLAEEMVQVVFEETWLPAAGIVVILALSRSVRFLSALLEPALICTGHNAQQLRIRLIGAIVFLAALLAFGRLSAEMAATAHLATSAVVAALALPACMQALELRVASLFRVFLPGLLIAAGCAVVILLSTPMRHVLGVDVGLFATIGMLALFWLVAVGLCLRAGLLRLPQP